MFARNCESGDQVHRLVESLREAADLSNALVLIDQEGGRVARLTPPEFRAAPAAQIFGVLAAINLKAAREAAYLNARLFAAELEPLGINVDCLPLLDVPAPGGHGIIGDRAFSADPIAVAVLGAAVAEGLIDGGV
ncbi:MAG TPA: beta-hexosaminidase, partial [Sneathiellales bacterium]|nr:beta-hexosaminidase [Sneathiellales bacterium]